jgi:hypothetical protein
MPLLTPAPRALTGVVAEELPLNAHPEVQTPRPRWRLLEPVYIAPLALDLSGGLVEAAGLLAPRPVLRPLQLGSEAPEGFVDVLALGNLDTNSHALRLDG